MKHNSSESANKERDLVFYLNVKFRRNASMQGTLQWLDGRKTETFRSALELANLINDAQKINSGLKREDNNFKTWQRKESVS